ncbi:MAG: beta-mannanase [Kiritimatiellae bacterium]|nr:beta-mannanase [Verrucomicrobiota bacterium]MBU4366807.1 beta-mannanase [Verrucomicrobiota bacterium]MCG2661139.1 beta-mannanase [Kiritimatiellia bacterium]
MPEKTLLREPGTFTLGCNYWASHAGTAMWTDWRPDVVEADLKQLADAGLQVLRVFPLWPVFQPLAELKTGGGEHGEYRFGESPLPDTEAGFAGVSEEAMEKFKQFADLAEKYRLKLIASLITGWMSGRLFVPPALADKHVLTDPLAIFWQVRFVRYFVRLMRGHPAIVAWGLGNECNCMDRVKNREAAWLWTYAVSQAIRGEDMRRPIISDMHGIKPAVKHRQVVWTIQDQAELTDILTVHPYPRFTPYCDLEPINTMRTLLHATVESRLSADIGKKPCFAEELGTLGPFYAGEKVAAQYIRSELFSLWAHDCRGMLWWCAFDQLDLEQAPYDWTAVERELGLIRHDRTLKPVLEEIGRFGGFIRQLPIEKLPPRTIEAACILTHGQDSWGVAYSSFILAKQAGFDLMFCQADENLPEKDLYLLPSLTGAQSFSRRFWLKLLERVKAGATLYVSLDDCILSAFKEVFGLEIQTRERRSDALTIRMTALAGAPVFNTTAAFRLNLAPLNAEILGTEPDGNPAFTCTEYGKGRVYLLTASLEMNLCNVPGVFHADKAQPFWDIYRYIAAPALKQRVLMKDSGQVGITEHPLNAQQRIAVLINYSPAVVKVPIKLAAGWRIGEILRGAKPDGTLLLPPNDAAVWMLAK